MRSRRTGSCRPLLPCNLIQMAGQIDDFEKAILISFVNDGRVDANLHVSASRGQEIDRRAATSFAPAFRAVMGALCSLFRAHTSHVIMISPLPAQLSRQFQKRALQRALSGPGRRLPVLREIQPSAVAALHRAILLESSCGGPVLVPPGRVLGSLRLLLLGAAQAERPLWEALVAAAADPLFVQAMEGGMRH